MLHSKIKNWSALFMAVVLILSTLAGCSGAKTTPEQSTPAETEPSSKVVTEKAEKITITYALADPQDYAYWDSKAEDFTAKNPNITVDIECFGGTDEMMKNLKIRQAGNELPDVIQLKPDFINDFKTYLMEWDKNDAVVKKNAFALKFEQEGKIYGLPLRSFSEFVYYKKSIFKELNLEIPKTWEDFITTAKTIESSGKYTAIAMGGKDVWPVYPFNEFMPHLISNDEKILSNIAAQDEPFSKGGGFYDAYAKINDLYRANVMGQDPLGIGCDQAQQLFEANKAAMIVLGQWYLPNYIERVKSMDDIGFFSLPVVSKGEKNRVMTMADNFLTINKDSKNIDAAKAFVNWSFEDEIYSEYLKTTMNNSTVTGVENDNPLFKEYRENSDSEEFMYYPGNEDYSKLVNQTKFDAKTIGQRMLAGENFADILKEYNTKWKEARASL